jgi:hypothetical protein
VNFAITDDFILSTLHVGLNFGYESGIGQPVKFFGLESALTTRRHSAQNDVDQETITTPIDATLHVRVLERAKMTLCKRTFQVKLDMTCGTGGHK